jgi:hypothetical protein
MQPQPSMTVSQQWADAAWRLAPGQVRSLRIGPGARMLHVCEGPLWLTARGSADALAPDLWLEEGQDFVLPSGAEVVVEGWPQASFQLLVLPQDCRTVLASLKAWFLRLWTRSGVSPAA